MDLTKGPVAKTLFRFSFPFMLSTLLQTLYSTMDTVIVGQFLGSAGLSAVSNGSQMMQMVYMICIGFSTAGQVLIAQAKGAGNRAKINKVISTLMILQIILAVIMMLVCCLIPGVLLNLLNTPEEAFEQARYYIIICGIGVVFTGLYNMFAAVLRGLGDSKHPLLFVAIASVLNIVLDIFCITVLDMNVAGAAVATVIGQVVSVVFSFYFLAKHSEELGIDFHVKHFRYDGRIAGQIIRLGIPMAIQSAAIHFSMLFVSSMINVQGVDASAAYGVMCKIKSIPSVITQGLGLGTAGMVGQCLGADDKDRVSRIVWTCMLFCLCVCAVFAVGYLTVPELFFRMFTSDEGVMAYAVMVMSLLALELPACVPMPACNNLISAQGFVALSFVVAMLDAFVGRVFLCWFCGMYLGMGTFGYFLGSVLGTYVTAILVFIYFISGLWRKRKALDET